MPIENDEQRWKSILDAASPNEVDLPFLRLIRHEFKRNVLFLRVPDGITLPESLVAPIEKATLDRDMRFRLTHKWATMEDLDLAVGEVSWLWRDWIPQEMITILAGEPGTGKSQLALWFCKIVTQGQTWPSGDVQEVGNVIFVDAESAQVITKERVINMSMDKSRIYIPNLGNDMLAQPDLNDENHRNQITQMVEEVQPKLIIVDSLGGVKSGRENGKEDMQPVMLYLTRLVQNRKCGIIVLHHLNKTKREEDEEITMAHLRGSTTIAQFARSILFLSKKPQGTKLWVGKSNIAKIGPAIRVIAEEEPVQENGHMTTVIRSFDFETWQEDIKLTKLDECAKWIIDQLYRTKDREMLAKELFELARIEEPYTLHMVKDAGKYLEDTGQIRRSGGKYSVWSILQFGIKETEDDEPE